MGEVVLDQSWPEEGLERVDLCPICGNSDRALLHKGLQDRVFFCAPGEWMLYQCRGCATGYLDPRPTSETIGLAYRTYFTHTRDKGLKVSLTHKVRRVLADGYRRYHYGTASSVLGVLLANILPTQKAIIDAGMRHLPSPGSGGKLLDIGCGNGEFLARAKSCGWVVVGVEPDPKAAEVSQSRGIDVRVGSIDSLDLGHEQFDGITIRHVIEHLHDPISTLHVCYKLLKPGGWIWIETPNLDSQGHRLFGADWRDLDPPRHLIIFNPVSLIFTLEQAGFHRIQNQPWRPICSEVFNSSNAIAEGRDPLNQIETSVNLRKQVRECENLAKRNSGIREFITVKAWRK